MTVRVSRPFAMNATRALLSGIVDYAGLFPPAQLAMRPACENYASYRDSATAWMLGRFVIPATRLAELERTSADLLPRAGTPWRLSALGGASLETDLAEIARFNEAHGGAAVVDAFEVKAATMNDIARISAALPAGLETYIEIPIADDPAPLIDAIKSAKLGAKMRTGGVTPDAFPPAQQIARFLARCVAAPVPFKATAGLHHPLRAEYRLTYAPDAPRGVMYGYLNVFLAAALLRDGGSEQDAVALLEERDPRAFTMSDDAIAWRGRRIPEGSLAALRQQARAFGSCSFTEPTEEFAAAYAL